MSAMAEQTRRLHSALDAHARRTGVPISIPRSRQCSSICLDRRAPSRGESKAAFLFASEGCWSRLPLSTPATERPQPRS